MPAHPENAPVCVERDAGPRGGTAHGLVLGSLETTVLLSVADQLAGARGLATAPEVLLLDEIAGERNEAKPGNWWPQCGP